MARLVAASLVLALAWPGAASAEPAGEAQVSLQGTPAGVVFQRRSVAAHTGYGGDVMAYKDLCAAPCTASVPAGTQQLALRAPGGDSVVATPVVLPPGPSSVVGEYHSRSALRIMGWSIAGAGVAGGIALMATDRGDVGAPTYAGIGVLVGGLVLGGALASWSDSATIRVVPAASAGLRSGRWADARDDTLSAPAPGAVPGLSVISSF